MFTLTLPWFPILAVLPQRCTKALEKKRAQEMLFKPINFAQSRQWKVQKWTREELIAVFEARSRRRTSHEPGIIIGV